MKNPTAGQEPVLEVQAVDAWTAVIAVDGDFDGATAPLLKECIEDVIREGRRQIVVDLTGVAVFDSISIAVLIGAWLRLRDSGGLAIAAGERGAGRTLRVAGVHLTVPMYADRASAIAATRPGDGAPAAA